MGPQIHLQHEELPAHRGVDDPPQPVPAEAVLPERRLLPVLVSPPAGPLRGSLLPRVAPSLDGEARTAAGRHARLQVRRTGELA